MAPVSSELLRQQAAVQGSVNKGRGVKNRQYPRNNSGNSCLDRVFCLSIEDTLKGCQDMQKIIGMVTMQINERRRLLFNFVKCSQLLKCRS